LRLAEVLSGRKEWKELWSFRDELREFGEEKGSVLCYYIGEKLERLLNELSEAEIDLREARE